MDFRRGDETTVHFTMRPRQFGKSIMTQAWASAASAAGHQVLDVRRRAPSPSQEIERARADFFRGRRAEVTTYEYEAAQNYMRDLVRRAWNDRVGS